MTGSLIPTTANDAQFLAIFNRLAVALREQSDESGVTVEVYFEALRDLPIQVLESSARALMTESGRRFFPTTAEWRTLAERAYQAQLREAVKPRAEPWHLECEDCEDVGWQRLECTGDDACGRRRPHAAHVYVRICPCRPRNRTFQRHQLVGGGAS